MQLGMSTALELSSPYPQRRPTLLPLQAPWPDFTGRPAASWIRLSVPEVSVIVTRRLLSAS
jgi:hypothetical protein